MQIAERQKRAEKFESEAAHGQQDRGGRAHRNPLVARKNAASAGPKVAEAMAGVGNADNAFARARPLRCSALTIFDPALRMHGGDLHVGTRSLSRRRLAGRRGISIRAAQQLEQMLVSNGICTSASASICVVRRRQWRRHPGISLPTSTKVGENSLRCPAGTGDSIADLDFSIQVSAGRDWVRRVSFR
jgi:hypothetical protein